MLKKMLSMLMAVTMLVTCFPAGAVSAVSPEEETVDVIQTEPEDIPQETPEEDPTEAEETDPPAVTDPVDIPDETEIAEAAAAPAEPSAPIDNPKATKATATSGKTGDCTWSLNGTELTISGNGAMPDYTFAGGDRPWGYSVTKVTIQSGVTNIGDYAFYGCSKLTSVTLGNSITSIGYRTFYSCSSLTNITIPDSVTRIDWDAFYNCSKLTSVTIGNSVTNIGNSAFYGCSSLTGVYITDLKAWCEINFSQSSSNPLCYGGKLYLNGKLVTNLVIPKDVHRISDHQFYNCSSLTSVTIGNSLTSIAYSAFRDCSNLTSVTIGNSVTNIDYYAFYNCIKLTSVTIGNSATSIGDNAFSGCSSLTSVTLGNRVTSIGYSAFSGCSSLTDITIPNSVAGIGSGAFSGCSSLKSLTIPFVGRERKTADDTSQYPLGYIFGTASYTGGKATTQYYYGDSTSSTKSTTYYIPTSLKFVTVTGGNISYGAFYNCSNLTSVTLGNSVTGIGDRAFYNCSSLTSVTLGNSVTGIGNYAFYNCSSLTSVSVPDSITSMGESVFSGCNKLVYNLYQDGEYLGNSKNPYVILIDYNNYTTCQIHQDTKVIYDSACSYSGMTNITIPDGVTCIGYRAFYSCSSLTNITIPDSVTSIGNDAFLGCYRLSEVYITDLKAWCEIDFSGSVSNPLTYGEKLYLNGGLVTNLVIPEGIETIGGFSFSGYSGLTSVTLDNSVTSIGNSAFSGCSNLTNVTIGNGVTSIGNSAFSGCSSLTNVTIPDCVTSIGYAAFSGCSSLQSITIPFVGNSRKTASDTYQYPFGYIFGGSSYAGGTATQQSYYESSTSYNTYYTYYIPDSLKSVTVTGGAILYGAFHGLKNVNTINLCDNVTGIEKRAFYYCTGLTNISMGNGVTSIGDEAFYGCSSLTDITIPESVTSIGSYAFYNCSSLNGIWVDEENDHYSSDSLGVLFDKNKTELICVPGGMQGTYRIPDSVTSIGSYAFYNCSGLTDITIPDSVTSIGSYAFYNCSGLTDITIPDDVTSIGNYTFYKCSKLTSVTISDRVTSIGDYAFCDCSSLTDITIPDSVISIGDYAFCDCSSLTSVTLGNSVTSIGNSAFSGCSSLTNVTIPDNVTSIGNNAFSGCSSLTNVTIPDSVTGIGDYAFRDCSSLISVTLCNSVTSIGDYAFYGCSSLTSVVLGNSVTSIGDYAFCDCSSLTDITIPDSVTSIGGGVLSGCSSLESLMIPFVGRERKTADDTRQYPFGYIFGTYSYTGGTSTKQCYYGSSTSSTTSSTYYIPTSLKSVTVTGGNVLYGAFYNCSNITQIIVGDTVTAIEPSAFSGCSGLVSMTIPFVGGSKKTASDTYQYPFGYIFGESSYTGGRATTQYYYGDNTSETTSTTYYIPTGLKSVTVTGENILYGAFYNCSSLTSVTLGNSVTSIGDYAFYNCSSLTNVTIPDCVTSIGGSAFSGCSSLTDITIPDDVTSIGNYTFYKCSKLTSVTIPDNVTSIGNSAFYNCSSLTTVTIGNSVTSIGNYAFSGCSSLTNVTIPDNVTSIGNSAFSGCSSLTSMTIPDSVTSIGGSAFSGCRNLESITIPFVGGSRKTASDTYQYPFGYIFGGSSYAGGTATQQSYYGSSTSYNTYYTYYIPDSLKSVTVTGGAILYGAFHGLKNVNTINLCDNVTGIEKRAFYYCTGLTSISMGNGVTSIGDEAFYGCSSLTDITIPESVTSIGSYAFHNCSGLTDITIPDSVTSIGSYAFYNCSGLTDITIPDNVTSIGNNAFSGCSSLNGIWVVNENDHYSSDSLGVLFDKNKTELICVPGGMQGTYRIPHGVTSIGCGAFYACTGLTEIAIPGSVTSIGDSAFYNCSSLTCVTIGNSVTGIGDRAFYNCSSLTNVTVPDCVASIGYAAFSGCSSLQSMTIPFVGGSRKTASDTYQYSFGYIFGESSYTGGRATTQYYYGSSTSSTTSSTYCIPTSLKSVTVTGGNIPYGAFYNCSSLTSVTLGNSVTGIGDRAFYNCSSLTSVTLGNSVTGIGDYAFRDCSSLISVTLCNSVTSIGDYAFSGCSSLTNVTIPDNVTSIGNSAFYDCSNLTFTTYQNGNYLGNSGNPYMVLAKMISKDTTAFEVHEDTKLIMNGVFSNCTKLAEIVLPDGINEIGAYAFSGCSSLESMTIPFVGGSRKTASDTYQYPFGYIFGGSSYTGGTSTRQYYYGSSASSTTSSTYYIPTSLKSVTVTSGNLLYGAFYNCKNLTRITIGKDVLSINKAAFTGCTGLERIEVDQENPNYCSVNGVLYNKDKTEIIWAPANHKLKLQVNYLYVNGESAADSVTSILKAGAAYSIEIPEILGYSTRENSVTGTMPAEDLIIDVIYYENAKLNGGACNENITWTLYADGMLVLRGSGVMPDYTSGGTPWAAYADQVQTVYIDSRITSIGSYAFQNCSNMTFIDYGYSVATIGEYAFSGCSSLTSFKLPASVTVVSTGAFSNCTGLKAVVIPDNITAVGDNAFAGCSELIQVTVGGAVNQIGSNAFSDCENLTQIYFRGEPAELGGNALGSTTGKLVYYYSTISGWDEEITDGKWHGYEAIPYNAISKAESFDGTNVYIIKVVDKHNTPLKNAVVNLGGKTQSTNSDGMAYFVKPTQAQTLKIECSNHITFVDEAFTATATQLMDVIELSDRPSVVQGVRMNGESIATSIGVLNCAGDNEVSITVSGYSKYAIVEFRLYQGNRLIATGKVDSANGGTGGTGERSPVKYTFSVKANAFEEGQNVLVRMHTADGNTVASALNIDVIKLASISEEQILGELSGIELAIGFGGMGDYKIPLNINSAGKEKVYSIISGRTIKVGINLDLDLIKDEKDEKKAKTALHKMVEDAMENKAKGKAGFEYNICGYLEIEYLGNNQYYIKSSYVKMGITAKLSFNAQASWFGVVGVYFKAELSGSASLDLHITRFEPEDGFHVDDLNFAMEDKLEIEGGAYILWGIGSAGIYGSITMGFQVGIIPEFEMESVYLSGELGVKWSLLWGLKRGQKVIAAGDFYRWPEHKKELAKKLYEAQQDPDSYTDNDRAYLENRSDWQEGDYLQTNIYDQVAPEVVTCGDTTIMVWLDDNSQRDSANYQTLYYSVYSGGAWSAPVAVDDNGTFDCEFDLYTDGKKIYVIYTELKNQSAGVETLDVSDQSSIEAFVSGVEVCVAVFENGSFSAPLRLTNNSICEMLPSITSVNGKLIATWVETNAVGLSVEAAGSTVRSAVLTGSGWEQQVNVADWQNMVSDIVTVCLKGETYTAYIVDADGSGETDDDQALILKNQNGEAKQLDMGVIANTGEYVIDGMQALTWYNNGKIYMITDPEQQIVCLVPENTSVSSDYQIVSVDQEQTLLLTVMSNDGTEEDDGTDIYGMYVNSTGCLTAPVRLTQTEGYIGNYSVSYRDEKLVVVFTETLAEISGEDIHTVTHLRNTALDFYTDITLKNVEFDITAVRPNTGLEVTVSVTNNGTNNVDGITVNFYDHAQKLLYTTDCAVNLESGTSEECKTMVTLPGNIDADAYYMEVLPKNGMAAVEDSNTGDNRAELKLAYADLAVEAEQKIIGEKNYIILSVANYGNTPSKAGIAIYAGDQNGRKITSLDTSEAKSDQEDKGMVEPGETEQYFVDIHALISKEDKMVTCVVTPEFHDPYMLNNMDTVTLLHIQEEIFVTDPEQVIRNPELSVIAAEFDKYKPADIAVKIMAEADSFSTVEGLTKGRDYTFANGMVTICSTYLSTLDVGKHTLNFVFDFGYDTPVVRSVAVTVSDSTPISLTGSIGIIGEAVVGDTVYADVSALLPRTARIIYTWTVDGETVGSDNYYAIKAADLGKTLKLTVVGGEDYTGSFTAEAVVMLKKPAAPASPLISKIESASVTLVKVAGMEYSLDMTGWQESHVFTDLLPNETYTFYARKQATDVSLASDASAGVTVTTLKETVATPAAPQVESKTYNSITLVADPAMEYRIEGGSWTDNNVFTGLVPNTAYVFYQRYQETETAYASEASTASFTTEDRTPIGGTVAIEGKPYFGTELTAVLKDFTGETECISYQWYRDGVAIDGAVNSTHTVTRDDMGKTLEIRVSGTGAYQGELIAQLEIPAYIPGDVNSDGYVNSNDVLYFLRFTLSPGRYPINQSGDMNGDGYVNSNDVLYLLRHILSPGRYPLYG